VATLTKAHVVRMMRILKRDRETMLLRLDAYNRGIQDDPWMPDNADTEYRLLAERSKTNIIPFIISTPAQALYVDQFRRGQEYRSEATDGDLSARQPEWDHWERSNLQSRQHAIYRGALNFGHAFTVTEFDKKGNLKTRGLSALRTSALFEDPANDIVPLHSFHVKRWNTHDDKGNVVPGEAIAWDEEYEYKVTFHDLGDDKNVSVTKGKKHKAPENPVTRFVCHVDLEGRTTGVVEPLLDLQNRLNQTVFDMLVVQSYASFKVRTVTGMAPPVKMVAVYENGEIVGWEPELDEQGRMIPDQQNINARRWMWAEDPDVKFGTLDETPLDGFISAIDLCFRHIAALGQLPPHHLLGQIANLSAEALVAAETALERKVTEFKSSFGESWERVFRLAMAMLGEAEAADDFNGEVIWRDMEQRSLSQAGDALGKLREQLGIPARGLWSRVPGATAAEIRNWEQLAEEESPETVLARTLQSATADNVTQFRQPLTEVNAEEV
jgi:hypothetical protein